MDKILDAIAAQLGTHNDAQRLVDALEAEGIGFVVGSEYDGPPIDRVDVLRSLASELGYDIIPTEESKE